MKGLVLAGGAGTRLRPITHTGAKQLIPVANKPIVFYVFEHLAAAGITDVGVVVGETADEVCEVVGDGSRWGLKLTYIRQAAPLGLAHAVLISRDFLGDDEFVMYLGDNLLRDGVDGLIHRYRADPQPCAARILLTRVPNPQQFGVVDLGPDGEVCRLLEKPEHPTSDLALAGVYLFGPAIHEAVRAIAPSARGELEITDAIQWLLDHGHRVAHEVMEGWWKDTGTLAPLLEGNRLVLGGLTTSIEGTVDDQSRVEGAVVIGPGAVVRNSVLRGPVIIGADARIVDSSVGPFVSISDQTDVLQSTIEDSIVLSESKIIGVATIRGSLIGRAVEVSGSDDSRAVLRLMLGDHSRVQVGE